MGVDVINGVEYPFWTVGGAVVTAQFWEGSNGRFIVERLVSHVPEPATWAMMIGGLGIAGAALRRRRFSTSAT